MNDSELRSAVLLSMQVALLGCVGPRLRMVACHWNEFSIMARAVFDGEVRDEDRELMSEVETEMMAHFPHHQVLVKCERCDVPQLIDAEAPESRVFHRLE